MRLPLLRPEDLSPGQRSLYAAFERGTQAAEYQGFVVRHHDGEFVGPWGVMMHFPALAKPLAEFIDMCQSIDGVTERARQAAILTVGGRFRAGYEVYAHTALGIRAGLRPDQIAALTAGARPADLDPDELLAAEVAASLTIGGPLPGPLYDAAVDALGQQGFDSLVFTTIHYLVLGVILNAYDVPAEGPLPA